MTGRATARSTAKGKAVLPAWGDGMPGSVFSRDGSRLFYLVQTGHERGFSGGELWVANLDKGDVEKLFPGVLVNSYDVSTDGQSITYSSIGPDGAPMHGWPGPIAVRLYPVDGGSPIEFCSRCFPKWTSDGREMFFALSPNNGMGIGSGQRPI
jgi:hypothetical protein